MWFRRWLLRPLIRMIDHRFDDLSRKLDTMNAAQKAALAEATAKIVTAVQGVGVKVTEEAEQVRADLDALAVSIDEIVADEPVPPG